MPPKRSFPAASGVSHDRIRNGFADTCVRSAARGRRLFCDRGTLRVQAKHPQYLPSPATGPFLAPACAHPSAKPRPGGGWRILSGSGLHHRIFHWSETMTKISGLGRRQFLVGTGVLVAHTAIAGRTSHAASAKPSAPPDLLVAPAKKPAAGIIQSKQGAAPGYIISGRGQDLSNPYFRPQGKPSNKTRPKPPAATGRGLNENDQGENQQ
jgi:hypothetical protein